MQQERVPAQDSNTEELLEVGEATAQGLAEASIIDGLFRLYPDIIVRATAPVLKLGKEDFH